MNVPVLELVGTGRRFGSRTVLHPVSLRMDRGTVCLVNGGNGSGKTTLLRMAAGILTPSWGTRRARDRAVYLRPGSGARVRQRVGEAVRLAALLAEGHDSAVEDAIGRAGLDRLVDQRVGTLSAGQRGRLLCALALVTRPGVACLDEPTAHLDAAGTEVVRNVVRELADGGCSVLLATQDRVPFDPEPDARLVVTDGVVRTAG
jgi:ABC-type multidrug transport system ATPase subunit